MAKKGENEVSAASATKNDEGATLDAVIDEFFQFEDQRRRFKNDITQLMEQASFMNIKVDLEHSPNDLSVIVGIITNKFDFCQNFLSQEYINFEIHISQRFYPQKGTRISCKSPFLSPCLCDGRDFLQDILGHAWHHVITLIETAEQIIEFVKTLVARKTDSLYLQKLGKYYLGRNYFYDDIKQFSALNRIPCVQFEDNFFVKLHIRIIGITDAHFLVFDAEEAEKKIIKLLFWSDLQSISEIKRKKDEGNKLTFKWKNYQKNAQTLFFEQTFQIQTPDVVIQQILRKMQKFQRVKIWSNSYMNYGQQWDSKKQVIDQMTQNVFKNEDAIKHKFNIENVQKLIFSYNEIIEHYSAVNDYLSEIFLNSLHNLLNRPDVQCLLNYNQIEKKKLKDSNLVSKAESAVSTQVPLTKEDNIQEQQESEEKSNEEEQQQLQQQNQEQQARSQVNEARRINQ